MKTSFGPIVWIGTILALVLFCSVDRLSATDEKQVEQNICFHWAFGAVVGTGDNRKLEAIKRDRELKTGDQFKMFVELKKRCFVYVISRNSQGEVGLLFPYDLKQFGRDYETSKRYYIPPGEDKWLELDGNVGLEKFYLLATVKRFIQLEEVLKQHEAADKQERPELAERIVMEIHKIRKKQRRSTGTAERPVRIGGGVKKFVLKGKSLPFDLTTIAVEISAVDFFGKTYTIDHR